VWLTVVGSRSWMVALGVHGAVAVLLASAIDRRRWTALMQRRAANA